MKRLRVMTIIGTRPEIIRLSRVIVKLDRYCDHILVHTGQNYDYELNQVFFDDLELRQPNHFLNAAGATAAETIGNIIIGVDRLLGAHPVDALLVLGDTNSCLSVIPAKRRKVPVFHMEAGNRCFDDRVPEEINRRIIDHTADINMTYSSIARDYLLREGLRPETVIKTGSPMAEVLAHNIAKIGASDVLTRLGLRAGEFIAVSAHREENIDAPGAFAKLAAILNGVAEQLDLPVLVSTHPRTRNRAEAAGIALDPRVRLERPLPFSDYVALQSSARVTLSDSGTITEESSILNFPALNIRDVHERPEGMEEGAVIMTGLNLDRVMQGIAILADQARGATRQLRIVGDYDVPNVSDKVVRIIQSYTDFVNRTVWKKY